MEMFCFQCQEAAGGKGCTIQGVCGKLPRTAKLMDVLLYAVRGEAIVNRALRDKGAAEEKASRQIIDALFSTITNANFDEKRIDRDGEKTQHRVAFAAGGSVPSCPGPV